MRVADPDKYAAAPGRVQLGQPRDEVRAAPGRPDAEPLGANGLRPEQGVPMSSRKAGWPSTSGTACTPVTAGEANPG